ncbi:MAG: SpoIIE family protein phosphatase [Bacteroidales bacterium]|nr:SpoIIE family protein phosphatase [Bacteroidales bacterium]
MKEKELSREKLLEQRRELMASLKYASFIQRAVLPDQKLMENMLKDFFIFHQPRDIVSGDFYYCARKEDYIVVASGDCTGHGVPGALMSIMGISFLNEILSIRGPIRSSRILNLLRERVMKALHQRGYELENKDAIDISLCVFHPRTGELQFSGANNPLYHIRNRVLTEIKADKMPVGIDAIEENSFTNHVLQLKTGDIVYLFSDGYPDQFGGPENKKFKYGPFRELLIGISDRDMEEQKKELDIVMKKWKGDEPQVDDILIIGIRFK